MSGRGKRGRRRSFQSTRDRQIGQSCLRKGREMWILVVLMLEVVMGRGVAEKMASSVASGADAVKEPPWQGDSLVGKSVLHESGNLQVADGRMAFSWDGDSEALLLDALPKRSNLPFSLRFAMAEDHYDDFVIRRKLQSTEASTEIYSKTSRYVRPSTTWPDTADIEDDCEEDGFADPIGETTRASIIRMEGMDLTRMHLHRTIFAVAFCLGQSQLRVGRRSLFPNHAFATATCRWHRQRLESRCSLQRDLLRKREQYVALRMVRPSFDIALPGTTLEPDDELLSQGNPSGRQRRAHGGGFFQQLFQGALPMEFHYDTHVHPQKTQHQIHGSHVGDSSGGSILNRFLDMFTGHHHQNRQPHTLQNVETPKHFDFFLGNRQASTERHQLRHGLREDTGEVFLPHDTDRRIQLYAAAVHSHYRSLSARTRNPRRDHDVGTTNATDSKKAKNELCTLHNPPPSRAAVNDDGVTSGDEILRFSHWTYNLCPRRSVQQLHWDFVLNTDDEWTPVEEPGSVFIGTYIDISVVPNRHAAILEFGPFYEEEPTKSQNSSSVDYYINGDACDEISSSSGGLVTNRRLAKVITQPSCCSELTADQQIRRLSFVFPQQDSLLIQSVEEPRPCLHTLRVCPLCSTDGAALDEPSGGVAIDQISDSFSKNKDDETNRDEDTGDRTRHGSPNVDIASVLKKIAESFQSGFGDGGTEDLMSILRGQDSALPPMPPSRIEANLETLRSIFSRSYDSYMYRAFPAPEIKPLSCHGGNFDLARLPALTLIDTLDTLVLMGNYTEFARSVERLRLLDATLREIFEGVYGGIDTAGLQKGGLFAVNQNVSVFETNIRALGGLLSAHQLAVAYMNDRVETKDVFARNGGVLDGIREEQGRKNGGNTASSPASSSENAEQPSYSDEFVDVPPCPGPITANLDGGDLAQFEEDGDSCQKIRPKAGDNTTTIPCAPQSNSRVASPEEATLPNFWKYDGILLTFAHDLGLRLLPAFKTETGIPYGTINLLDGVPSGETPVASLAGGGTLSLEFELLSRLVGDASFGNAAKLATRALWLRRSSEANLVGKHIDTRTGSWTESRSGVGSNSDSFYEYILKHYALFPEEDDFWTMFLVVYSGLFLNSKFGDWYGDVEMGNGSTIRHVFESLMAFYPGLQVLLGELTPSFRTMNGFFLVRELVGFLPERFNYGKWAVDGASGASHPLRPELLESCYFMHLAATEGQSIHNGRNETRDGVTSSWLWAGDFALQALNQLTAAPCGHATIGGVSTRMGGLALKALMKGLKPFANLNFMPLKDEMASFFVSETVKYLFLLFDRDNIIHNDPDREWIFTTEAHPIHSARRPPSRSRSKHEKRAEEAVDPETVERVLNLVKFRASGQNTMDTKEVPLRMRSKPIERRNDHWTGKSNQKIYSDNIGRESTKQKQFVASAHVRDQEPFFSSIRFHRPKQIASAETPVDVQTEELRRWNLATVEFRPRGLGNGYDLSRSCPNFAHPSLRWIHALDAQWLAYAPSFITSFSSEPDPPIDLDIRQASALTAASLHGVATEQNLKDSTCEIGDSSENLSSSQSWDSDLVRTNTHRVEMSDLGAFDIFLYPDGVGFTVTHVRSGETLEASIVYPPDEDENLDITEMKEKPYVMVIADTPDVEPPLTPRVETTDLEGDSDPIRQLCTPGGVCMHRKEWISNVGHLLQDNPDLDDSRGDGSGSMSKRAVIMGDLEGHAFLCHVLVEIRPQCHGDSECNERQLRDVMEPVKFPCSPGLFGQTTISSLVESGGIVVEAEVQAPDPSDVEGCNEPEPSRSKYGDECKAFTTFEEMPWEAKAPIIRLVKRGVCSFERKARVQHAYFGADAVIVLNTDPGHLFVMAADNDDVRTDESSQLGGEDPLAILVSREDGQAIDRLVQEYSNEDFGVRATIRIVPQTEEASKNLGGEMQQEWPILRTTPESVSVFASKSWGFHAVQKKDGEATATGGEPEWQLYIAKHDYKL